MREAEPFHWLWLTLHLQRLLSILLCSPNPSLSVSGTGQVSDPRVWLNWKDLEVPVSHCIERETDPETVRDPSEVPQLGPGTCLLLFLQAPQPPTLSGNPAWWTHVLSLPLLHGEPGRPGLLLLHFIRQTLRCWDSRWLRLCLKAD